MQQIDNTTQGPMYAHNDGYILTQVELCKKMGTVKNEFKNLRKSEHARRLYKFNRVKL